MIATTWAERAACIGVDERIFFPPPGGTARAARRVCGGCPVQLECLRFALNIEEDSCESRRFGIYAGLTPIQRAKFMRKARP